MEFLIMIMFVKKLNNGIKNEMRIKRNVDMNYMFKGIKKEDYNVIMG